jgi:hypothetical protein
MLLQPTDRVRHVIDRQAVTCIEKHLLLVGADQKLL